MAIDEERVWNVLLDDAVVKLPHLAQIVNDRYASALGRAIRLDDPHGLPAFDALELFEEVSELFLLLGKNESVRHDIVLFLAVFLLHSKDVDA